MTYFVTNIARRKQPQDQFQYFIKHLLQFNLAYLLHIMDNESYESHKTSITNMSHSFNLPEKNNKRNKRKLKPPLKYISFINSKIENENNDTHLSDDIFTVSALEGTSVETNDDGKDSTHLSSNYLEDKFSNSKAIKYEVGDNPDKAAFKANLVSSNHLNRHEKSDNNSDNFIELNDEVAESCALKLESCKGKIYTCDICKKECSQKEKLSDHMEKDHQGINFLICSFCPEKFLHQSTFESHMTRHFSEVCSQQIKSMPYWIPHGNLHANDKSFICKYCSMPFETRSYLNYHLKTIHVGELKQYECKTCGKIFTHASNLKSHIRTHSQEKRYKCKFCEEAFVHLASLKRHWSKHLPDEAKNNQDSHLFVCGYCDHEFKNGRELQSHVRIHTGEKLAFCPTCEKPFSNESNLKTHQRIHSGEKRYWCDVCDILFTHGNSFLRHKRSSKHINMAMRINSAMLPFFHEDNPSGKAQNWHHGMLTSTPVL